MFSVLIIDSQPVVRLGLRIWLTEEFANSSVREASSFEEALLAITKQPWTVVLVDVSNSGGDGLQLVQQIRQRRPATRTLVISSHLDPNFERHALRCGAWGVISKGADREEVIRAVRMVLVAKKYVRTVLGGSVPTPSDGDGEMSPEMLSSREYAVLRELAAGKSPTEIATAFQLSVKTVSTYKRRIFDKLRFDSVPDLVRYALDHDLC